MTRESWVDAAMEVLVKDGDRAVTVDVLSSKLEITRGSFYHHFNNRQDLSKAMLEYWAEKWTIDIRDDVEALGLDGYQSLRALGNLIHHRGGSVYDVAVRAWAHHDSLAMKALVKVDKIRLGFISEQFRKIGFEGLELENRSRLFLYYNMSESAFTLPMDEETNKKLSEARFTLLTSKSET